MTQTKESNSDRSQNNNHKDHEGEVEMLRVVACIDGSQAAPAVCDYASWASKHMETPMMLLHVLDEEWVYYPNA